MNKKNKVSLDKQFLFRLIDLYLPFKWPLLVAFVVLVVNQFANLAPAYLVGLIIDGLSTGATQNYLVSLVVISGVIKVVNVLVIRWRINYEFRTIDYKLPMRLSELTLSQLFTFSPGQNRSQNSGKVQSVISQGENALSSLLPLLLYNMIPIATQVIVATMALLVFDWILGSIVFSMIVFYFLVLFWLQKKFDRKIDAHQDLRDYKNSFQTEILRHLPIIQLSGQEKKTQNRYRHRFGTFASYGERMWPSLIGARNLLSLVIHICESVIILLAVFFVLDGKYGAGAVVTLIMWLQRSTNGINQMSYYHKQVIEYLAAIKKYFTVMDVKPAVREIADPKILDMISGRIEFIDVSFTYPDNSKFLEEVTGTKKQKQKNKPTDTGALKGVNLVIEPGQKVAFVGESGAGKSTIVSLLMRAYDPCKGAITIDGHDLVTLSLKDFRGKIGFVEQNVTLWDSTIKANILYGIPSFEQTMIDNEDIEHIMKLSRVSAFEDRLTDGIHTKIGENGVFLSGGERQRVGIARALIKNPSILILDEATSNLDAINERFIKEAVDVASVGRTTIIIAHRLSTVRDADKIFVLNKGCIVGVGTHEELLASNEVYQNLVQGQLI
jgi:ABC-type multidrug transport system fused ATPase/permease subunit